jgi:radical SAM protein with 4Fe4S-binding SPASM domain
MRDLLARAIVPSRLALIYRSGETLGYNPGLNTWDRLGEDTAEVLRWLRARRAKDELPAHLVRRFDYTSIKAAERLKEIVAWCVLRRLLYLDRHVELDSSGNASHLLSTVYWICTQRCNLRCKYCYQDAAVARPGELTTEEGKALVDQAVEAGASSFVFTGGEPFTRDDLFEIARYSRDRGLVTNVITNGHYITRKTIAEVAEIFDTVTLSIDHGRAEVHDRSRGSGSWIRAVHALDLLMEAGVTVDVNSVITSHGLSNVKELLQLIQSRRVSQHRVTPRFPMGRGANHEDDELSPGELLQLNHRLHEAKATLPDTDQAELRTEGAYSKKMQTRQHCGAGLSEISVDPEGWVYPCRLLQYPDFKGGNIRTKPLASIYRDNLALRAVRDTTADKLKTCKTCVIRKHCGGGCRGIHYSFTKEYLQSHPLFCAFLRDSFEHNAWQSTGSLPSPRAAGFSDLFKPSDSLAQFVPVEALQRAGTPR